MFVLVTGFGPFDGVEENPSGAMARELDGLRVGPATVVGRELPVAYEEAPRQTILLARELPAVLVVGLGVAVGRGEVQVESRACRELGPRADVVGRVSPALEGPAWVSATMDVARFSEAMGVGVSTDAGRYVCNAWLYEVARTLRVPVGFVHIPKGSIDRRVLLDGIDALLPSAGRQAPGTS